MTHRLSLAALAAFATALGLSCSDALPCSSTCPPIEGVYLLSWTAGTPTGGCTLTGPQPSNLNFSRAGSTVRVPVGGVELSGTLFDTWDFSVSGGSLQRSYSLKGRVTTTGPSSDAGVRLLGSLFTRESPDGGVGGCSIEERYTADKL